MEEREGMMPYFEGKKVQEDGLTLEDNPYPEWERNFEEWDEGYFDEVKRDKNGMS